jgi:hypothetical protein
MKIATYNDVFIDQIPHKADEPFECPEAQARELFGQRIAFPVTPEIQKRMDDRIAAKAAAEKQAADDAAAALVAAKKAKAENRKTKDEDDSK